MDQDIVFISYRWGSFYYQVFSIGFYIDPVVCGYLSVVSVFWESGCTLFYPFYESLNYVFSTHTRYVQS